MLQLQLSPCKIGNREFESDYHHRPHFLAIQLFQRKYLGYTLNAVSLSLYIFVGRVGLLHYSRSCYTLSRRLWFVVAFLDLKANAFGDELIMFSKTANADIWIQQDWRQIFIYFRFHFDHDGGPGERSYFEVFFSEWGKLCVCKIWSFSDTPNRFFANKCHIFYKYPMGLFFPQYLYSCSPVRIGIIRFGSKLIKNLAFTYQNFWISLCYR